MKREDLITATEEKLKIHLQSSLKNDFRLHPEVKGRFLVDGTPVRIDFLAFPHQHLIKQGFPEIWFGIEVKSPGTFPKRVSKGIATCWQSITYSQSEFGNIRPAFVLMFPYFSAFQVGREGDGGRRIIEALLQKANVGNIEFRQNGAWVIRFGSQPYWSQDRGAGKVKNIGLKRYVGNNF